MARNLDEILHAFDILERLPAKEKQSAQLELWDIRLGNNLSALERRQRRDKWIAKLNKLAKKFKL